MRYLDVCRNLDPRTASQVPYLLVIQADLLQSLGTRVVVPLRDGRAMTGTPIRGLMPAFDIEGIQVVASTPEMAGVAASILGPVVGSLRAHRGEVVAALDLPLMGV